MSSREVGTQRAFDAAAADFAALGRYLWEPIGAATVVAAGPAEGDKVLDACCGTGASAIPAAHAVGAGGVVDAIDLSGPMIGELRRLSADLPQLRAHEADATAWGTGGYDVVQSALGIFFFPDMTDGTDRLIARARPGGRAVFTIWRGGSMVAAGRHLGRAVAAVTDSAPPAEREPSLIDRIDQAGPYAAWLSERNLSDVDVVVNELRLSMTPEIAWLVVIGSGFRGLLADLEPGVVERVRERYLESLRAEGVTELDATTLIGSGTVR
ncbi:class I SAM-dependent methyltransferase [Amycolatopsis sp. EV170708-02-1]|uniref:class I SAM-dependent methyltransferase n=1 Tax=Amycolatopsis sp. EV170708-02-1 TaxID=2919322 RepID=UPI001F0C4DF8|nr:class I SAM-dependent methyltransferase [Amycolatopsis sp. EV170708-02-1]UMO99752.1 methyltransferase domain-containing protein [Amycolatopsis sp. EV170708-02-1]